MNGRHNNNLILLDTGL